MVRFFLDRIVDARVSSRYRPMKSFPCEYQRLAYLGGRKVASGVMRICVVNLKITRARRAVLDFTTLPLKRSNWMSFVTQSATKIHDSTYNSNSLVFIGQPLETLRTHIRHRTHAWTVSKIIDSIITICDTCDSTVSANSRGSPTVHAAVTWYILL